MDTVSSLFLGLFTLGLGILFVWGFRTLPREEWQVMATLPTTKRQDGGWNGLNLTYYGFFTANAYLGAVGILFLLLGASAVPLEGILGLAAIVLGLCVPASRLIAMAVEKRLYTFTVGGASFVGIIITPAAVFVVNATLGESRGFQIETVTAMAALGIAYILGEGIGRLACISFGCCYGKPVADCPPILQRLFGKMAPAFRGHLKKASYEGNFDGVPLFPIQAITATLCSIMGITGLALFLTGHFLASFLLTIPVSQLWRLISEFCRADHRGGKKISAYQYMSVVAVLYSFISICFLPASITATVDLAKGLRLLWNPWMLLCLEALWIVLFLYSGRSHVTASSLFFSVVRDRACPTAISVKDRNACSGENAPTITAIVIPRQFDANYE